MATAAGMKDVYVQIKDIKGESTSKTNTDWTEVKTCSNGFMQATSGASTGSQSSSKVSVLPFSYTSQLDSSFTPLLKACTSGSHIGQVTVQWRRATGDANTVVYLEHVLSDVMVTGIHQVLDPVEQFPQMSVELSFGELKTTYTKYDKAGKSQGNLTTTYNAETNSTS